MDPGGGGYSDSYLYSLAWGLFWVDYFERQHFLNKFLGRGEGVRKVNICLDLETFVVIF